MLSWRSYCGCVVRAIGIENTEDKMASVNMLGAWAEWQHRKSTQEDHNKSN